MSPHPRRPTIALVACAITALGALGLSSCGDGGSTGTSSPVSVTQVGSDPTSTGAPANSDPGSSRPADTTAAPSVTPRVEVRTAASVTEPTDLVVRPGDDDLWVAERAGLVRRLAVSDGGDTLTPDGEAVLDITDQTRTTGEEGLLGLAFSSDGNTLYVSSTGPDGATRLEAYPVQGNTVDVDGAKEVFTVAQPFSNHNGGHITFGPDGKLWLGLGDGGSGDDPGNRAQDPDVPLGKMLRFDPAGGPPEIVMSGLRNPWRFAFDTDGSLWIGDVGQNAWEEIDHLPAGRIEGANMGWSGLEGTHPNPNVDPDGRTGANPVAPVFEYSHEAGNCSVTGGFVYRGKAIAGLQGAYLFADYCAGHIRAMTLDADGGFAKELDLGVEVDQPVSFTADADGEPYVLSDSGSIVRLVSAS